ncbi:MAG: hypothetical protein FK730_04320 [Asgard group archaeon]|nr:hypothetical protein [Asgard group archaeon]
MSEKEKVKETKKEKDEIPVEDIKEILSIVNKELPILIKGLFTSLYNAESAEQYAKGIAVIYKTLKEQKLPDEMVEKLVMNYSESINLLGSALKNIDIRSDKKISED